MKKLFAVAAFLLASTAAQAQYTFEYGGHTIRIDPDRGTVSIPGVYDNSGRPSKRSQDRRSSAQAGCRNRPRSIRRRRQPIPPQPTRYQRRPRPLQIHRPHLRPPRRTLRRQTPQPHHLPRHSPRPARPRPQVQQDAAPVARPAPAPVLATTAPPPKPPVPAVQAANSPLGVWLTEEKEGKVRIEQCGANLCGYSVDAKSNQNGEQVLINMKPGKDKWSGRISRSEHRQHLRFDDRAEGLGHAARSGLRLWRHVLRRPDLEPGELGRPACSRR